MWIRCLIVVLVLSGCRDDPSAGEKIAEWSESDLTADYETGMHYFRGGGAVRIDHNKAFEYFRQAAERGLPEAQAELAVLYTAPGLFDFLNAKDFQQAGSWGARALKDGLQERADAGRHSAQYELGQLYLAGVGVARDLPKAREWYEQAAANGSYDAKRALGFIYLSGTGTTADLAKAKKYFEEAASGNLAPAQQFLGIMYSSDRDDMRKDDTKAVEWFRKAADQGNPPSQVELGVRYEKGQGVPQSFAKAAEYYQQAADRGFWGGIDHLARLYEQGNGVPKDHRKAAELYEKLVARNIPAGKKGLERLRAPGLTGTPAASPAPR